MTRPVFLGKVHKSFGLLPVALIVLLIVAPSQAGIDLRSKLMPGQPEPVKLVRKLPAVAERHGRTVRFEPTIASSAIPQDVATILREKIRTLLLHAKEGEIQLVDGRADTVLRCTVTAYEPMVQRPNRRQVGLKQEQVMTLIGNMEASVHVLDQAARPLDAGNLKQHLEKDYIVSEQEQKAAALGGKATKSEKAGGLLNIFKGGGDAGDIARVAGAGDPLHDA
jgi:hypothetical protein